MATYVRILDLSKSNSRPLTVNEAETAMTMILAGKATPEQISAFLMLLRFKEETPEEIAGFVKAVYESIPQVYNAPQIDFDWSCYAGKRRQLPWFTLAALALSQSGVKIFIHGIEGHTIGRVCAKQTFASLGLNMTNSIFEASKTLKVSNICYLPLKHINKVLSDLIGLKSILGLRSPVHTIDRMVNPFSAPHILQGAFHPSFSSVHQKAAALNKQPHLSVFRVEGGEIERHPDKTLNVIECS